MESESAEGGVANPDDPSSGAGVVVWVTGLPSSGWRIIAGALAAQLHSDGHRVQIPDGDGVQRALSQNLGRSHAHRYANVMRISWVARLLASHGVKVLVPAIAPYADARDDVGGFHKSSGADFLEVYVCASAEISAERRQMDCAHGRPPERSLSSNWGRRPIRGA
jgi:adenylylsulfate kinase